MPYKYISDKDDSNPFGGGDILIDVFKKRGIINYLNSKLGKRAARAEYSYGDGILTWFISKCRGARRIENIYDSQRALKQHPRFKKAMSPDTFLYMLKELALPNKYQKKTKISKELAEKIKKGKAFADNEINVIDNFNELLIDIAITLGLLKKGVKYILDYDTTEIETKIKGSRKYYSGKGKKAYCPAVAMINNIPVYIENRNGDSSPSFNLTSTIEKILNLLSSKGIIVEVIRIDSVAYKEKFTRFINERGLIYVTRAYYSSVKNQKDFIRNWTETAIKNCVNDIGDTIVRFGDEETRMVVKKVFDKKATDGEKIKYWGLITNDFEKSNEEINRLYAQRGDAENLFSSLNEFGWEVLPMRKFEHNTVFLYVTALNYILFKFITRLFAPKFPRITENMELKTFRDKFLTVGTSWIKNTLMFSKSFARDYLGLFAFT